MNCAICNIPAHLKCGNCKIVVYCNREHQKQHWIKSHKFECKCFELSTNEVLGRHFIATRIIKQGELILRERPFVYGPKIVNFPICLACNKLLNPTSTTSTTTTSTLNYYKCSKCHWPMCDVICEKSDLHQIECELISKCKFKCNINYNGIANKKESAYCVIVPLRFLLLKSHKPDDYKKLMDLEHHLEQRMETSIYKVLKPNLLNFIRMVLDPLTFDDSTILKTAAILDTNAFELRLRNMKGGKIRGLYPKASMFSHNCIPNTKHLFDEETMEILFIATVEIPKGSIISLSYAQPLKCTVQRLDHLSFTKCFNCQCDRCADATELDTYMGSIICSKCKLEKMISMEPLNSMANWNCPQCEYTLSGKQIRLGNNDLENEVKQISERRSIEQFERFLNKYKSLLHERNTHILQIKYALIQLYGNAQVGQEFTDADIKRKITLCYELLDVAEIIEPGWSHFRGNILYELEQTLFIETLREFENDLITQLEAKEKLQNAMELLKEAVNIFKYDTCMKNILEKRIVKLLTDTNLMND